MYVMYIIKSSEITVSYHLVYIVKYKATIIYPGFEIIGFHATCQHAVPNPTFSTITLSCFNTCKIIVSQ